MKKFFDAFKVAEYNLVHMAHTKEFILFLG